MGLGNNNTYDTELVIINDVSPKDGSKSYFSVVRKVDGKWVETSQTKEFSGNLKSLKTKWKYDPNNPKHKALIEQYQNKQQVVLTLVDEVAKETYAYSFNFRICTRSFLNRLLNLTSGENLKVMVWNDKESGKNYENISLYQNDVLVKGKYPRESIPVPKEVKIRGKIERDYDDIDNFFIERINVFAVKETPTKEVESEAAKVTVESEDSVPF